MTEKKWKEGKPIDGTQEPEMDGWGKGWRCAFEVHESFHDSFFAISDDEIVELDFSQQL